MGQGFLVYFLVGFEMGKVAAFVAAFFLRLRNEWNKQRQMRGSFTAFRMTASKGDGVSEKRRGDE
jgi:hypothetical protein